jgi:hypothetical protein
VDTDVSSSAVSGMATSVLGSPSFSANDLMVSRVDLTRVFRLAATLCEGVDVGQLVAKLVARDVAMEQPVISSVDSP